MSYHLLAYKDREGGAVRPWRRAGSDPRLGAHGKTLSQRLWLTGRKATIKRQLDTVQMTAFTRRMLLKSRGTVTALGAVSVRRQAF